MIKNPSANTGDLRDTSSIPELGRSPGIGNDNPLQYSSLENSMDRGARQTTVHGVTESDMTEVTCHMHTLMSIMLESMVSLYLLKCTIVTHDSYCIINILSHWGTWGKRYWLKKLWKWGQSVKLKAKGTTCKPLTLKVIFSTGVQINKYENICVNPMYSRRKKNALYLVWHAHNSLLHPKKLWYCTKWNRHCDWQV